MPAAISPEPSHVTDEATEAAMRTYGIARVPTQTFEYGGYRYTNINDAVAEAKRQRMSETGSRT